MGQRALQQPDGSFLAADGSFLAADVVYYTVGGKPITGFLASLDVTDARGFIKVWPAVGLNPCR